MENDAAALSIRPHMMAHVETLSLGLKGMRATLGRALQVDPRLSHVDPRLSPC